MLSEIVSALVLAGEVNMTGFPTQLQSHLMLPTLWVAELLTFIIILLITLPPIVIFTQNAYIIIMIFLIDLLLVVAMGWLDPWIVLIITMITSGLWSFGALKGMLS